MTVSWKPILALLVLSAFLTEVLSSNISFSKFFNPGVFLFLITLGYGIPVLLIREIAVRMALPLVPVFVLGCMYGLYNEAFLAKTVFHPGHSPIDTFAQYGLIDNIRVPWTLVISAWHALFAVIYPIALVHWLYPRQAAAPWIRPVYWVPLGTLCLGLGGILYFKKTGTVPIAGTPRHLVFLALAWVLLAGATVGLARVPKTRMELAPSKWRPPRQGVLFYLLLLFVPVLLAGAAVPVVMFYLFFGGALWFCLRKLRAYSVAQPANLVRLGFGGQGATAILLVLLGLANRDVERAVTGALFFFVFALGLLRGPGRAEPAPSFRA